MNVKISLITLGFDVNGRTWRVNVATKAKSFQSLKALKTLRALRPLRGMSRWQGVKASVHT